MCGYVGFINKIENADKVLNEMMDKIIHRGPDYGGTYVDSDIAMGHRRLSIIDLESGNQPIFNEDESLVLNFNGEIYNYEQLREALIQKGHTFKTHVDSEVLIHAYEEHGCDFLQDLRGMFSFVIWDKRNQSIFGARDFFGIKPFYYAHMGETFMYGSEIKSFLPHPHFTKELNLKALNHYMSFQYSPGCESFFEGVYKLPPAHYFIYKDGKMDINRYWQVEFDPDDTKTKEQWIEQVGRVFEESVAMHKISDVEVGSFLSSGIDSSYVTAVAHVDKTFTVGFEAESYNEISYAEELSKDIGVKNIHKLITPQEYWETLPHIQYQMDEPLADPSASALYFVAKLASEHLKVVLSGEGADEIFGGYNIYQEPISSTAYNKIPFFIRKIIGGVAALFPAKRGLNFLVRRGKRLEERFIGNAYIFTKKERDKLLLDPLEARSAEQFCRKYYDAVEDHDEITKMQYLDLHMWMVGDILLKADKMSMANSVELRVPFLDKEVMHLAEKIPTKYRCNPKKTKYVLRKAASKVIPRATAEKKKLGFPVPIRNWLKEADYYKIVREEFSGETARRYFHVNRILKLLDDHYKSKRDNSRKIWTIYTFLVWHKEYFSMQS